ncbi:hypothetical protein AB3R30_18130 [Leptolyngbyaceae cyanobacterium UHCC 1019]
MPSDPYQSQVFRKLLRQTRHWLDRRQQTVRQVQVAASWSAQILIYPAYALFQSARFVKQSLQESLGKTLGKPLQQDSSSLLATENLVEIEIPLQSEPLLFTAETVLHNVLQVVDRFALSERLPIGLEPQKMRIRAIACLVETQTLVLVTQSNQILDVLNPYQQYGLAQRISWEVADYARSQRPKSLPKQVIEAMQGARSRLLARFRPTTTRSLTATSTVSVDTPIQQSMLAVRDYGTAIDFSRLPPLPVASTALSAPASIFIRGVATQLETRSLVLVTNRNTILDILDAAQQMVLQQRIVWEVAHYRRFLRLRQSEAQGDLVRSPSANSPVFPGVRPFYQLMAWMQQGAVAIATNLFKEADLVDSSALTAPLLPKINFTHLNFTQIRNRVTAALAPTIPRPERSVKTELTISERKTLPVTSTKATPKTTPVMSEKPDQSILKRERSPDLAANLDTPLSEIIDTEATLMGYELSLLERIMRLLDFCFLWVETLVRLLWNGLLKLLPKGK